MKPYADKKTILHLIETGGPGGAENVLINITCCINEDQFNSIVCLRKEGWLYDELIKRGVETYLLKENNSFDPFFVTKLIALIKKKQIALIHAHEFLMSLYGTIAGRLSFRPVVTTFHGKYYYLDKWRRRVAMQFISGFSQMITVSEELHYFLWENLQIPTERVKTIYNGIDVQRYSRKYKDTLKKSDLNISDKDTIVGTVGNLYPVKGQTYLLKAIPIILQENSNVSFLFIGRGDQEQALLNESKNLGISNYVRFLGFRSDVPELLNLMDIFVLPSLSECLPLSVLEAMAMGVPSVVTDVGGNREIIIDKETGFLVPHADPKALAEKIIYLLKNKKAANTIGLRAHEEIIKKFSVNAMLTQYESLYNLLLENQY